MVPLYPAFKDPIFADGVGTGFLQYEAVGDGGT